MILFDVLSNVNIYPSIARCYADNAILFMTHKQTGVGTQAVPMVSVKNITEPNDYHTT